MPLVRAEDLLVAHLSERNSAATLQHRRRLAANLAMPEHPAVPALPGRIRLGDYRPGPMPPGTEVQPMRTRESDLLAPGI